MITLFRNDAAAARSSFFFEALEARRLFSAGDLDLTFGDGGRVLFDVDGTGSDIARVVVVQEDGKILVAGHGEYQGERCGIVVRLNADGSVDTSFAQQGMRVTELTEIRSLVVLDDGSILAGGDIHAGWRSANFAVMRLGADGDVDTSFGDDGIASADFFSKADYVEELLVGADGKIIAVGVARKDKAFEKGDWGDFAVMRLNPDGSLDTTFDGDGKATFNFGVSPLYSDDWARTAVLQEDGKLILSGGSYNTMGDRMQGGFTLLRLNLDGSPDQTFGTNGVARTFFYDDAQHPHAGVDDLLLLPDGRILAGGGHAGASVLACYLPDGTLDTSFGTGGVAVAGDAIAPTQLRLTSDDRVVVINGFRADFSIHVFDLAGEIVGHMESPTLWHGEDTRHLSFFLGADGKLVTAGTRLPEQYNLQGPDFSRSADLMVARFDLLNATLPLPDVAPAPVPTPSPEPPYDVDDTVDDDTVDDDEVEFDEDDYVYIPDDEGVDPDPVIAEEDEDADENAASDDEQPGYSSFSVTPVQSLWDSGDEDEEEENGLHLLDNMGPVPV